MKRSLSLAAMVLAMALGQGIVALPQVATATEHAEAVSGEVTKIDLERRRVTVRGSDGKTYEFEASAETLKDLQVGDQIEAKRRPPAK
jgi:NADH dehydrogenase FAD-containing subunit